KSPEEMRAVSTDEEWQAGCDATLLIAERADVKFAKSNMMPNFPVPEGETEESWFRKEVWRGMDRRYPDGFDDRRRDQASFEMDVMVSMGFCSYFLVVADFIMWAKNNGIRVGPGRGSAAGSLVSYALGITDLDPLYHGLVFERFLNPERVSMPDIDIDFDERRRGDGLHPGARVPLRARGPDHQGVPARGDGQGHPAGRHLRRRPPPLRRGR